MSALIEKVKKNLILEHSEDDELIESYIASATAYAESYQKKATGYYVENPMDPTTEQAVIMLSSHFYVSRDGSTGGFYQDKVDASRQVWEVVNLLLRINRDVVI
jgi:uncharacterized phage protein (predicted DNA packaging)